MNAILREKDVAPVLTIEAIEVHLGHMQPDIAAVKAALPVLRDKIDRLSEKTDSKIDQANRDRAAGDAMLAEKIDQANKDRAAGDTALAGKIDHLTELVLEIQGSQKGLKWFIGSATVIFGGIALARTMGWI